MFLIGMIHSSNETISTIKYNIIEIQYSEVCKHLLITNQSNCPGLEKLTQFDTSNQKVSGKFIMHGDTMIREKPQLKNHFLFYQYINKTIVCVECYLPTGQPDIVKIIFIEPHGFTWADPTERANNNLVGHKDRYVSQDCLTASLPFDRMVLNDTIYFMSHSCKSNATHINNNFTITTIDHKLNYNNPTYQYNHYVKQSKDTISKIDCRIHECNLKYNKKW